MEHQPKKKTFNHPKAKEEVRQQFEAQRQAYKNQQRPIIYLDESGFKHNNCRPYGYAAKGQRCYGLFDWHGRNQTNAIGALYEGNLFALGLFDCTVNGAVFDA